MATTLIWLRRQVRSRVGVPMQDDFFTDDVIDDTINLAIDSVEAEQHWPWMEHVEQVTLDDDTGAFTPAADWRTTRGLFWQNEEIPYIAPSDLWQWTGASPQSPPAAYTVMADQVRVVPPLPAGSTLTHYYYTQPGRLRDDNDTLSMPDFFAGSVVSKAAELLSIREGTASEAAAHAGDYDRWIDRMRRDVRRSTGTLRVRVRPGSWI